MKLISLQVYGDEQEDIFLVLIQEGFLNEERFAKSYTRGKFRMKKWGRLKITNELKRREISEYCIREGLKEIEETDYIETLKEILRKQMEKKKYLGPVLCKDQSIKYAVSRGYEASMVFNTIEKLDFNSDTPF